MQSGGKLAARVIWYCNTENITERENQEALDVHLMEDSSLHSVCSSFLCCWVQREHERNVSTQAAYRWRDLFMVILVII